MRSVKPLELQLLPALLNPRGILGAIVLTQILCLILAFSPLNVGNPWQELGLISLFTQSVLLFSLASVFFTKKFLDKLSLVWLPLALLAIALVNTFVVSELVVYLDLASALDIESGAHFTSSNLLICTLFVAIFLFVLAIYAENMRKIELLSQAKYTALTARMHPHFLFNSLNNAAELTHCDPNAAEQMLLDLAYLARSALIEKEVATFQEELDVVKAFINIEKWRLGERLNVRWQIENEVLDTEVPSFILQPLIENAVIHGIQPRLAAGEITISIKRSEYGTQIQVTNPYEVSQRNTAGNGMALDNLKARLTLFYKQANLLTIDTQSDIFTVSIIIPHRGKRWSTS